MGSIRMLAAFDLMSTMVEDHTLFLRYERRGA